MVTVSRFTVHLQVTKTAILRKNISLRLFTSFEGFLSVVVKLYTVDRLSAPSQNPEAHTLAGVGPHSFLKP